MSTYQDQVLLWTVNQVLMAWKQSKYGIGIQELIFPMRDKLHR